MIKADNVTFEYIRREEDGSVAEIVEAVKDLSLEIQQGEFIAILGHNGSGKSTFAKLLNALLEPTKGTITIEGMNTGETEEVWNIRKNAGMIFQNPDNQIIGTMVEEDVAFGPENLGVPTEEIISRVAGALETVGMTAYSQQSPHRLSGGQKQRVAIAGVLAMQPKCIIFDESTAMLDPQGRKEVLQAAHTLNQEKNITVLYITHDMDEIIDADRVLVLHHGELVLEGTPVEVFRSKEQLKEYGLVLPNMTELTERLKEAGIMIQKPVLRMEDLIREVNRLRPLHGTAVTGGGMQDRKIQKESNGQSNAQQAMTDGLVLDQVSYEYSPKTIYAYQALHQVSLTIAQGEFVAIIGHTGSGKSTLIQQFNGLLQPTEGHIYYKGKDIYEKDYKRAQLRGKVGLVFQYPEYQLFAETVLEDVSFGPKNLGLPLLEIQQRAFQAIAAVGLEDTIYDMSPFELSGGQKRRVAIAGVLAMQPEMLVLDEPVAGLDPAGRRELLDMLKKLNEDGMTIVLVSHNMEDVAEYAKRIVVMDHGKIALDGDATQVFRQERTLQELGLEIPVVTHLMKELARLGHPVSTDIYRLGDAVTELTGYLKNASYENGSL
mgnify:CR=1 FL=1